MSILKAVDLSEPELSSNALLVLKKRYLKQGKGNHEETAKEMFIRVAENIAQADKNYPNGDVKKSALEFYNLMASMKFMPNSPTLMNAGADLQQLSACFVLPIDDSLDAIFESVKNTALIHKSGGGTGFSFSRLRPTDDKVMTTKGVSSGPVSFMKVFDSATETIKQGGTRRGANMGILRVDHPDIMEFIHAKTEQKSGLSNFNLSVAITDDFMKKVLNDEEYDLINPRSEKVVKKISAKKVFDEMVNLAWKRGDPGIVFIDRINKYNPTPHVGKMESTNPCGEQPLLPYESCNLGSINLPRFLHNGQIDWNELRTAIHSAVHFLDNVIDMNRYPLAKIDEMTKANRKIGLGLMGWADLLVELEVAYNSDEAIALAEKVMGFINDESKLASQELAKVRGNFPNFKGSIYDGKKVAGKEYTHMRNATTTTIAPTGTISIIANASSGIEPYFALAYFRNVMDNDKLPETNAYFKAVAIREKFYSKELEMELAEKGTLHDIKGIDDKWKHIFVTSHEISPEWHVKMQAAFQRHVDNAVSKTVNFSREATVEDVREVYLLAYKQDLKGITIYRDGSLDGQTLTVGTATVPKDNENYNKGKKVAAGAEEQGYVHPKARPNILQGKTIEMMTGCGKLYVTINFENGKPFEIFTRMGKAGGCANSQSEAIGRLLSIGLRSNIDIAEFAHQLKGISCHRRYGFGKNQILSCADAVAKALEIGCGVTGRDDGGHKTAPHVSDDEYNEKYKYAHQEETDNGATGSSYDNGVDGKAVVSYSYADTNEHLHVVEHHHTHHHAKQDYDHVGACPDCGGSAFENIEGCYVCYSCGFSKCG